MKPTHSSRSFIASRRFIGRRVESELFRSALLRPQQKDEYRILNWYGVGGQGKSALSREFMRLAEAQNPKVASARINLEDPRLRRIDEALLSVRLQLSRSFGHRFGAFDTAFSRHYVLTNPGTDIRAKHSELFRGENPLLDDLLDWSEAGLEAAVDGIALAVPGINLLYKYLSRLSARTREWFERRGKVVLEGLDRLPPDEILERLPTYLGADIYDLPTRRKQIIVDTHEALWRDHNNKDPVEGSRADAWLRLLVQDSPGVLFTVLGRDKLQWEKIDPSWNGLVDSHPLDPLSKKDADQFLAAVPISSAEVRRAIVEGAQGLPLYLDLQVTMFERLMLEVGYPDASLFGGSHPEILRRFLDHIGGEEKGVLRLASYPVELSEDVMNDVSEAFLGGMGHMNWGQLTRYSFIEPSETGSILMHAVLREELQGLERHERPDLFVKVHKFLFERQCQIARPEGSSQIASEHETAFEAALRHSFEALPSDWLPWFWEWLQPFQKAARYSFLERIFRLALSQLVALGNEHPENLKLRANLALQIGNQGRYAEAEGEFRKIWEIRRRQDVLGEDHPDTLTARHNLALQLGRRGNFAEAEDEFRAIWEIRRRPEVLGEEHPDTLRARANFAFQVGRLGRYAEAEDELRKVWEIRRRPDVLGEEHPETLRARANLALQIGNQGRYAEAEDEFRKIWEIRRRPEMLGEEHPETLRARANLALQIGNQGRYAEAEDEFRKIWEIRRRPEMLGEEHPETLRARANLALQIGNQGRYAEAEDEFRKIWEIRRRQDVLGEEHPETLNARANLARQIGNQGRYAEAEDKFRAIWEIWRRPDVFGEEHPKNLRTQFWLAKMLDGQGKFHEASLLLQEIEGKFEHFFDPSHLWRREMVEYVANRPNT